MGTVLLHALIVPSVLLGAHALHRRAPEVQGLGASQIKSATPPSDTLILVNVLRTLKNDGPLVQEIASLGPASMDFLVNVVSPDPLPHVEISPKDVGDDADAPIDNDDPAARAAIFGRYIGQIDARIERAWRRPRSPVTSDAAPAEDANTQSSKSPATQDEFKCQVRILQDSTGRVQEVQLLSCNGSVAWRQSLISAILTSSPLPAPPNPNVFTHALTMTFLASGYGPGRTPDDYEVAGPSP
jgi:hypothetical protein